MRRLGAAAGTTAVAALLAFGVRCTAAPVGWWWALVPVLAVAIAFAGPDARGSGMRAFRRGWLFGTFFVLADLAWVIGPATAHLGPVLLPVAVVLAAIEGLPAGLAAWGFARSSGDGTRGPAPFGFCYGVPAAYALLETARASGALGLPLATFGATQARSPLAVTLAIGGVPFASFVVLALAAVVVISLRAVRDRAVAPGRLGRGAPFTAVGLLVALAVSAAVWHAGLAARDPAPLARIGIVQAGPIDVGRTFAATASDYAKATQRLPRDVDFALWPEGVLFLTASDAAQQRAIAVGAAKRYGRTILVGATLHVRGALHNDLLALGSDGSVRSVYTKRRLVPFGEYQPFAVGASKRATYDAGASDLAAPVRLGEATPFGALICYEVAFAELTRDSANSGAGYVVAVLNDTWFGGTDGPDALAQLQQARAVESGIAIVRADAVSPSGAVDADGRWIVAPLRADGIQVVRVSSGLVTPFRRFGPAPALAGLAIVTLLTLRRSLALRRRRSS